MWFWNVQVRGFEAAALPSVAELHCPEENPDEQQVLQQTSRYVSNEYSQSIQKYLTQVKRLTSIYWMET
jgi:hypothetical protein